jgi:hypothetical protein
MDHGHLLDFLNAIDVSADQKWFKMAFDSGLDGKDSLCKCRTTQTVDTGFRGDSLHNDMP